MKTCVLNGPKLDWAVAKALNIEVLVLAGRYVVLKPEGQVYSCEVFAPSTNWAQGGPIIERERIDLFTARNQDGQVARWIAYITNSETSYGYFSADGTTPLVAAMRCLTLAGLGEEVEVPENLFSQR